MKPFLTAFASWIVRSDAEMVAKLNQVSAKSLTTKFVSLQVGSWRRDSCIPGTASNDNPFQNEYAEKIPTTAWK